MVFKMDEFFRFHIFTLVIPTFWTLLQFQITSSFTLSLLFRFVIPISIAFNHFQYGFSRILMFRFAAFRLGRHFSSIGFFSLLMFRFSAFKVLASIFQTSSLTFFQFRVDISTLHFRFSGLFSIFEAAWGFSTADLSFPAFRLFGLEISAKQKGDFT